MRSWDRRLPVREFECFRFGTAIEILLIEPHPQANIPTRVRNMPVEAPEDSTLNRAILFIPKWLGAAAIILYSEQLPVNRRSTPNETAVDVGNQLVRMHPSQPS